MPTPRESKPKLPPPDFTSLIEAAKKSEETDFRLMILQSLTQTPHRQIEPFIPLFRFIHEKDPIFFGRLAVWYNSHGSIRDLKQLFVAFLSTSSFSEDYREAGAALLSSLPPFEVERVLGIIKGHKNDEGKFVAGITPSVPRIVRTAISDYLKLRKNSDQFDQVALTARNSLKTLYSGLRIRPGEYAQRVLFDNDPPESSRLYSLKTLARSTDPNEQARLIIDNKIPYRVAVSALSKVTAPVLVALVNAMTPAEVINNMASLQKRGALDNADIKALVDSKIKAAETDKRVSALKSKEAVKSASLDQETVAALEAVADKQIKKQGKIKKATALLIDKSGSMQAAIEVGKQLAALIAPICEKDLFVYAFDSAAYPIEAKGSNMSDWEKAFKGIDAAGYTSCGAPFMSMSKRNQRVEQVIIVTDQMDNKPPFFPAAFSAYKQSFACEPNVVIINVKGSEGIGSGIFKVLEAEGVTVDQWNFTGDYYGLPSLLPMLAGGSKLEFLQEVLETPMPVRKKAKELAKATA